MEVFTLTRNGTFPLEKIEISELKGTEKQIEWAEKLRAWLVKGLTADENGVCPIEKEYQEGSRKLVSAMTHGMLPAEKTLEIRRTIGSGIEFFAQMDVAGWWVKHKNDFVGSSELAIITKLTMNDGSIAEDFEDWLQECEERKAVKKAQANGEPVVDLSLMTPEEQKSTTEATVSISGNTVRVRSEMDEKLRLIVKAMNFSWDSPYWKKDVLTSFTDIKDAAAETVNALLNEGFPVVCKDAEVREKAISGNYTPVPSRTITSGKDGLHINWDGWNDALYQAARRIKGAKWSCGSMLVNPKYYDDIEGFAELNGFVLSPGAVKDLEAARAAVLASTVKVAKHKESKPEKLDLEAILERPAEVMDKHRLED